MLDIPATDAARPLPLENESIKRSHFCLADPSASSKPASESTLYLDNSPAAGSEPPSEPPSEAPAVGALDYPESGDFKPVMSVSVSFDDRKHERKWKAVSPRELALFLAILLESSQDVDSSLPLSMNGIPSPASREIAADGSLRLGEFRGMSRDRLIQIRRTLFFPELAEFVDIIEKYTQSLAPAEKSDPPRPPEPGFHHSIISDYLTREEVSASLSQALTFLEFARTTLDERQQAALRSVRKSHRYPETVLWFVATLYANLACGALGGSVDREEFQERLVRGLFWVNVAPLSQVLAEDVHYLVRVQKKDNKQKERRMCSVCSTKEAAVKKRTEFICVKCNRPFCNSTHCFVEYHMTNEFPFYRYMNVENCRVCSIVFFHFTQTNGF